MAEITSKRIGQGDPVTSDTLNNIINDLYLLNKETSAQSIILQNVTEDNSVNVSSKIWSTPKPNIAVNPKNTPSGKFTWVFPKEAKFTKAPRCWAQITGTASSTPETLTRIHLVVVNVSTTQVEFYIRSGAGATAGKLSFDVFAAEA